MFTFLAINGIEINAETAESYGFIAAGYGTQALRFARLLAWLQAHTEPLDKKRRNDT